MGLDLIQENKRMHLALPSNTEIKAQGRGWGRAQLQRTETKHKMTEMHFKSLRSLCLKACFFFFLC